MSLKNRINVINKKLTPSPQDEASQQDLARRLAEARQCCIKAGIILPHWTASARRANEMRNVKRGNRSFNLAEFLNAARESKDNG
jgi:hypothetical protein